MSAVRAALVFAFFVSGFAALLYQIIWQRMLSFFGGADVYAVTIIVSAFMGGLGFGSLAGGYLADRLGARGRLLAFAACELAVAVFAAFSATIYYDLLYVQMGSWAWSRPAVAAVVFAVTLWPTFFMGMSLPLLTTAITQDARHPARWVPILYGWNTLGAACGSFFAAAVLFRTVDLVTGVRFGALLSFGCAIGALIGTRFLVRRPGAAEAAPDAPATLSRLDEQRQPARFGLSTWIAVYALSGFVALSLEIVWFRILGVILKSNAFTFGHLLAVYLGGLGVGALAGNSRLARSWRPAPAFFALQAAIPIVAVILLALFVGFVHQIDVADPLWQYLGRYETLSQEELVAPSSRLLLLALYVGLPIGLLALPTLMMGVSFACLQRAVQTDLGRLGRRVGWLQAANIIGSMAGAMLTGLVLLDLVGSDGTLRLLVLCSAVFLMLHGHLQPRRVWPRRAVAIAFAGVVAYLTPSASTLWARLHGAAPEQIIVAEDGTGLSLLKSVPGSNETVVHANGLGQSALPYGGLHTALGALPAMLHPAPVSIAIIGLGSGDTLFGVGGRPETQRIDSIEIVVPELETLRQLERRRDYPALRMLLHDARVQHWFTDGRMLIRRASQRYDVIEADALRPTGAYAGHLYSVEYFALLRDRLNPGGLAVTWAPTPRVVDSFVKVFPHVLLFDHLAIGSTMPLSFDRGAIVERMQRPFTRDYYRRGAVDIDTLLAPYLGREPTAYGPDLDRGKLVDVNQDLFPKDEFAVAYGGGLAAAPPP